MSTAPVDFLKVLQECQARVVKEGTFAKQADGSVGWVHPQPECLRDRIDAAIAALYAAGCTTERINPANLGEATAHQIVAIKVLDLVRAAGGNPLRALAQVIIDQEKAKQAKP